MPMQSAIAQIGAAKQSGKGTAAASPTFAHGITDGAVLSLDITQDADERTSGSLGLSDVNRTAAMPGAGFTCRAHPKSVGLYLYAALGAKAVTGAGPYTHTLTPADSLPYLTLFGKLDAQLTQVTDFKVDSLTLSFSENDPLEVQVEGMGTALAFPGSFSPSVDDTAASYFTAVGGTFLLDTDSATPAAARITAGEIAVANGLEGIMASGSILPDDLFNSQREVTCSFDIVPDNLNHWRTIATGSNSGAGVSSSVPYGSFSVSFVNGTDTLTLVATRVAFTCDFPDADAGGGPVSITLAGLVLKPSGGAQLTATLVNAQASY